MRADANFRIFSETLLAGVLEERHELAIMTYRESHRGTLLGMTRFRDGLDDMPILGYGKGSLNHDRLEPFHSTLSGHSLNYLTRGTYWGTEQRQQKQDAASITEQRYRNDCGTGGEDCSLCMVSSVASSYWVRWMFLSENADQDIVYVARGAPGRWYAQPEAFGISDAPTRFGTVSYSVQPKQPKGGGLSGWVELQARDGAPKPVIAVRLSSGVAGSPFACVHVGGSGATLIAWHAANETVVIQLGVAGHANFSAPCSPTPALR